MGSEKKINTQPKLLGVTKQSSISHRSFGQRYLLSKTKQSLIQQNSLPEKNPTSSDKNGEMVVWLCVYLHMCLINIHLYSLIEMEIMECGMYLLKEREEGRKGGKELDTLTRKTLK